MSLLRTFKTITFSAFALAAALAFPAQADLTAYVVHGINGEDFGFEAPLPVDINVDGLGCAVTNLQFGERVVLRDLPEGTYDVTVSLADEIDPCAGAAVLQLDGVVLPAGANATVVAHRTADGLPVDGDLLGLGITASIFGNDFSATDRGRARVLVHHAAAAPAVDLVVSRDYADSSAPRTVVPALTNPTADGDGILSQVNAQFRPGNWDVALEVNGATVFGPTQVRLKPFTALYVYAVGDFFGGTFQYLVFLEDGSELRERIPRGAKADRAERRVR